MTLKIVREEGGIRGLYRGLVATAFGVAPYVGINFAAYEFLRGVVTPPGKNSVARKLSCGALAGTSTILLMLWMLDGRQGPSLKH
jgi:solute carrier family 25 phosphate transporter 23/24/25/41